MPEDIDHLPRISVDQAPRMGHRYPFIDESDLAFLIHDLCISYPPEPSETASQQNTARFVYPLRIKTLKLPVVEGDLTWEEISLLWEAWDTDWESPLSGSITRVAPVVVDDDDNVVFDPVVENARYHVTPWGTDRLIVEWLVDTKVMRLVVSSDAIGEFEDDYIVISGVLDPRTYEQVNSGVLSVTAASTRATPVFKIRAGNNMRIDVTPTDGADGTRRRTRLSFNAIAGAGMGKTPGCTDEIDYLTSINNQTPDESGRIFLSTDDCYRLQLPLTMSSGSAHVTANSLQLFSSCTQVCPPQFYVNVYRGISKLWDQWQEIADRLTQARDNYIDDISRWEVQRECRRNNPAKLMVIAEPNCRLAVSAIYCNAGKTCLIPLEMRFKFEMLSGLPTAAPTQCGPAYRKNSSLAIEEAAVLTGSWPTWYTRFDYSDPQSVNMVRFRICVPGCSGRQVKVTLSVGSPDTDNDEQSVIISGPVNGSLYDTRALLTQTVPMTASPPPSGGMCSC